MRRTVVVVSLALLVGVGWWAGRIVLGEEAGDKGVLAKPRDMGEEKEPAQPADPDQAPEKTPAKTPRKTPKVAPKGGTALEPPPPLPDVEIPAIPEVDKDPFKPGLPPVRVKPPDILEEGKRLFNREGRLDVDKIGRAVFVFDSGDKPMYLLESASREYLEKVTDYAKKTARWRVSGIVTVYGKQNFLLLTKVVQIMPEEEQP
jgi:hypothetical protein